MIDLIEKKYTYKKSTDLYIHEVLSTFDSHKNMENFKEKMDSKKFLIFADYLRIKGVGIDVISIKSKLETAVLKIENIRDKCLF